MKLLDQVTLQETPNIAIVLSRFNRIVTDQLLAGAQARFNELVPHDQPLVICVPGAVEIPFIAQKLAKTGGYDAIVALGVVIRGETTHYDYVCEQVSAGCQQVMLQYDIPVIFGVLTTENLAQALDRVGGAHGHKGRDAIDAAFHMVSLNRQLA